MRRLTRLSLIFLVFLSAVSSVQGLAFQSSVLDPPRPAPEVALKTVDGVEFRLSHHRGEVILLSFGYTLCPDVCPLTLATLAKLRAGLGKAGGGVRVVFVTVDPERDTPERLRAYTRGFDSAFIALTGTPKQLAEVRQAYGIIAGRRGVDGKAGAYLIDHWAPVYVVDPNGRLRLMFLPGTSVEDMLHDITLLQDAPAR